MAVLSLEHVTLRYGDHVAVRNLSLSVAAGEIFGLLGPNGSGKSSTLAAIAGDLPFTEGTIDLAGQTERDAPLAYRRRLGFVPQELALFEDLSAEQNLLFFGRLYGLRGTALRQRVDEVLGFVLLEDRAEHRVNTFSGGMQRRLNLACAILHRPQLLLLDEPTVGLDIQSREALFDCLRQLRLDGSAMLFTTHHLEEAEALCDRIGIMDHGELAASGDLAGLCQQFSNWRWDRAHKRRAPALERVFLELTGRSLRD